MSTSIKKYLHDIDLQTNRLLNARMHPVTTAERTTLGGLLNSGDTGILVYDTTQKIFYVWDVDSWYPFSVSDQLLVQIQEAYDKYTKDIVVTSSTTEHNIRLISRDDTYIEDKIVFAYIHDQGVPLNPWVITHNLGRYPSVTIVDSANDEVIGEVKYNSVNQLTISFSGAFSGKAYLN